MSTFALVGNGTVILKDKLITDFVTGDCVRLDFDGDVTNFDMGKTKSAVIAFDANGLKCHMTIRVVTGGKDDKFLREELDKYVQDPPAYALITGSVVGRFGDGVDKGDGYGTIRELQFKLAGGHPKKLVPYYENASGDTNQVITTFEFNFVVEDSSFTN